ncbi:MAG: hypothetical protein OEY33_03335 [Bdellovibrionales bacterium]|jgi:PHP family Zn ribbon phosphoesterase|nr:hypothetical protein [Bdellovibrionales bacterium]
MKLFAPLFIVLFLTSFSSWASFSLNVEIIHKKGMDKGLVLVSEVHSVEDFYNAEEKEIFIGKDWLLSLKARFKDVNELLGPAGVVIVKGSLFKKNKSKYELLIKKDFEVELGKKVTHEVNHSSDQVIELSFTPNIR